MIKTVVSVTKDEDYVTKDRAEGGHAGGDRLTGIENVGGCSHADLLIGNGQENDLQGRKGNDTLDGGAGDDNLLKTTPAVNAGAPRYWPQA